MPLVLRTELFSAASVLMLTDHYTCLCTTLPQIKRARYRTQRILINSAEYNTDKLNSLSHPQEQLLKTIATRLRVKQAMRLRESGESVKPVETAPEFALEAFHLRKELEARDRELSLLKRKMSLICAALREASTCCERGTYMH